MKAFFLQKFTSCREVRVMIGWSTHVSVCAD